MTATHRVPFGDISNKENVMGAVGVKKAVAPTLSPFLSYSQEDKEVENELFEQVGRWISTLASLSTVLCHTLFL